MKKREELEKKREQARAEGREDEAKDHDLNIGMNNGELMERAKRYEAAGGEMPEAAWRVLKDAEEKNRAWDAAMGVTPKEPAKEAPKEDAEASKSIETGSRGGRFYVNASGTKVYVGK